MDNLNGKRKVELEIIEYILRLGNAVPERKIKIKCKNKNINFEKFMDDWKSLIEIKISRSEKMVTINNIDTAMNILKKMEGNYYHTILRGQEDINCKKYLTIEKFF